MITPRPVPLSADAAAALRQILGIMADQFMSGEAWGWDLDHVLALDARLAIAFDDGDEPGSAVPSSGSTTPGTPEVIVEFGIDDASLLLTGMAFTEMASVDLPWFEMVRWTSDFVTAELRRHWTDEEWQTYGRSGPQGTIY